jgi:uncharacterized protein RhaS with RHS repeats
MSSIRLSSFIAIILASGFMMHTAEARFLSVDPADSGKAGSSQSWNQYTYVLNNPVKLVDPNGEEARLGQEPERGLAAARLMVPANVRHSIGTGTNDAGQPILTIDNSIRSDSLNYNNLRKVINSPGVVEINVGDSFSLRNTAGQTASTSLTAISQKGVTLPSPGTVEQGQVSSTTPGVTEVHVQQGLSDNELAPVLAAEIQGHALPVLLGESPFYEDADEHREIERPAVVEAQENREQ